jgi:hypothetical protein
MIFIHSRGYRCIFPLIACLKSSSPLSALRSPLAYELSPEDMAVAYAKTASPSSSASSSPRHSFDPRVLRFIDQSASESEDEFIPWTPFCSGLLNFWLFDFRRKYYTCYYLFHSHIVNPHCIFHLLMLIFLVCELALSIGSLVESMCNTQIPTPSFQYLFVVKWWSLDPTHNYSLSDLSIHGAYPSPMTTTQLFIQSQELKQASVHKHSSPSP